MHTEIRSYSVGMPRLQALDDTYHCYEAILVSMSCEPPDWKEDYASMLSFGTKDEACLPISKQASKQWASKQWASNEQARSKKHDDSQGDTLTCERVAGIPRKYETFLAQSIFQ